MKRMLTLLFLCLSAVGSASAGETSNTRLEKYLAGAVRVCPGERVRLETVDGEGPTNFASYRVTQTSSIEQCGTVTYALLSPRTGQVLVGPVFPLGGTGSLELRIGERLSKLMGSPVRVTIARDALEDGIRRVQIQSDQDQGTVSFDAYVDESGDYLILGRRGHVDRDPKQEFLEALGASSATSRGRLTARVRILELSDFQCPSCRKAHEVLKPVLNKYEDRISYARLDLPLIFNHDWSLSAAMGAKAVATVAPQHYWSYVDHIFENQSEITKAAIDTIIRGFCDSHEIDWKKFEPIYRSEKVKKEILAQVGRAFFGTPTFIINGREVFFGHDADFVKEYLLSLLAGGGTPSSGS